MKILVIGVGYVGLVSGTCFAEMGYQVECLDIDEKKIQRLKQGNIPLYEPGLEEMVQRNIKTKRLSFITDYTAGMSKADVCFIAVDTPMKPCGNADISQVEAVARSIGEHLHHYAIIATKSTVPVGTTLHIAGIIQEKLEQRGVTIPFDVVSNPEFLKEGNAVHDFMKPDRVIIGANHQRPIAIMKELYSPFMHNHDRLLVMDIASAELSKYAANAMLATRISFMNEMASLCEKFGANITIVRKAIGSDDRIGSKFLYPGVGFGGSCLPKDVASLIAQAKKCNIELSVLQAVDAVNHKQKKVMKEKLDSYFSSQGGWNGKTVGILGLSFKPDTDDIREASSLVLMQDLLQEGVKLRVFDPIAMPKTRMLFGDHPLITWCQNELDTAEKADAIVLMTEWKQFRQLDLEEMLLKMNGNGFFDGRNQYQPHEMSKKGFDYFSIGQAAAFAVDISAEQVVAGALHGS
jgi:UDPglucose 6-dehydrogenase